MNKIIQGDSLEVLKKGTSDTIDCIVTDPPYGYSFMGKDWDKAVPSVELWKECLRVLKPGGFAFVMSAPRQDVLSEMIHRLGEAGFKTDFTSIYWTYASGFPKAMNIGKMVDKRLGFERERIEGAGAGSEGNTFPLPNEAISNEAISNEAISNEAISLNGSYGGFQPKPAVEVIIVAMKPLSEKTYVDQALKNGKGITWLDDCRIPTESGYVPPVSTGAKTKGDSIQFGSAGKEYYAEPDMRGRFPANLLVSDDVLNDGRVTKSIGGKTSISTQTDTNLGGGNKYYSFGDSGSYSRYFDLDKWANTLPFLITPKASKSEKDKGLDEFEEHQIVSMATANGTSGKPSSITEGRDTRRKNHHPTVKPLKLMSYLITLGSREGDLILDPFCGSGTTCLAAKNLNRNYIGIEREEEYVNIANARLQ